MSLRHHTDKIVKCGAGSPDASGSSSGQSGGSGGAGDGMDLARALQIVSDHYRSRNALVFCMPCMHSLSCKAACECLLCLSSEGVSRFGSRMHMFHLTHRAGVSPTCCLCRSCVRNVPSSGSYMHGGLGRLGRRGREGGEAGRRSKHKRCV